MAEADHSHPDSALGAGARLLITGLPSLPGHDAAGRSRVIMLWLKSRELHFHMAVHESSPRVYARPCGVGVLWLTDRSVPERRGRRPLGIMTGAGAQVPSEAMPARWAMAAASVRLAAPSLARMFDTWTLAVLAEMNSSAAMSRLLRPPATRRATSAPRPASPRTPRAPP